MSDYTGLSMDRELARLRHAELLEEAADWRADQNNIQPARTAWLALSVIALVLVAGAAWVLILS